MLTLNKRIFKKILILTICLIVFSLSFVSAVVNPTQEFYVNDYAGLLSKETKDYIINVNKSLNSKTRSSNCYSYNSITRRRSIRRICNRNI